MDARLLSVFEVTGLTGLGRDELAAAIAERGFPRALPLGPWHHGWREDEVLAWLANRGTDRGTPAASDAG